jgi:hypothetical protein
LKSLNIKYFIEYKIESLLRYDIYLPDYNCIIEFDGRQHFIKTPFFDLDDDKFDEARYRDIVKIRKCIDKNIRMLRFNHTCSSKPTEYLKNVILAFLKSDKQFYVYDLKLYEWINDKIPQKYYKKYNIINSKIKISFYECMELVNEKTMKIKPKFVIQDDSDNEENDNENVKIIKKNKPKSSIQDESDDGEIKLIIKKNKPKSTIQDESDDGEIKLIIKKNKTKLFI